ncbi:hypothetical protein N7448_011182 [Penicillium atrosanguineum]|uniref:Uncharacterized protein n=1 Tax=Penicillium atrosanguineum TaxID=1132637 RepID=A0A9W9GET2_9EURO|nr:hypothetical protein N7448_011182 [Penicillium atrosanguineum]KAJ5318313.1 hypothetical protein N7476_004733 [Penicillium atrosanguineum]
MEYDLSIEIFGTGEDPKHRSHWGFVIHKPSALVGDLFHVKVIDLDKLWYQFESRMNTPLRTMQAVGKVKLGKLSEQQRQDAIAVIKSSLAPRDGRKKCQDWVYDTLLSLEVDELVPAGTCHFWKGMVGKSAQAVQKASGVNWASLK